MEKPMKNKQLSQRVKDYHLAKFAVVGNIKVVDKNGNTVRTYRQILSRAFDEKDAKTQIHFIKKMKVDKHIGFNGTEHIYKKSIENCPRIAYSNNEGHYREEIVSSYEIMPVSEYFKGV
jgi:predicted RNA-binding protein YlqC (UPF0109 family)